MSISFLLPLENISLKQVYDKLKVQFPTESNGVLFDVVETVLTKCPRVVEGIINQFSVLIIGFTKLIR